MRKWMKVAAGALAAALVVVWAVGEIAYGQSNPPDRYAGVMLSEQADAVLKKGCFDCHSHETRYP